MKPIIVPLIDVLPHVLVHGNEIITIQNDSINQNAFDYTLSTRLDEKSLPPGHKENSLIHEDFETEPETRDYFEWWKIAEKNGKDGEKLIQKYLEKSFSLVEKVPDYEGYDFKVSNGQNTLRIEVKTLQSKHNPIFITRNELIKASQYQDSYFIYLVLINKESKKAVLYKVKNPIRFLNINMEILTLTYDEEYCTIENKAVRIQFNDKFYNSNEVKQTLVHLHM